MRYCTEKRTDPTQTWVVVKDNLNLRSMGTGTGSLDIDKTFNKITNRQIYQNRKVTGKFPPVSRIHVHN